MFIIGLSVLLLVQLLVSLTVPRAFSSTSSDEPAFLVISIEKSDGSLSSEDRKNDRDLESGVLGLWTDEDSGLTGYEDENELEKPQVISYSLCSTYFLPVLGGWYSSFATQKKKNTLVNGLNFKMNKLCSKLFLNLEGLENMCDLAKIYGDPS